MTLIVGVDEVGRGCLAGPVYAAAVVFEEKQTLSGLKDSKLLSKKKRDELFELIVSYINFLNGGLLVSNHNSRSSRYINSYNLI